MNLKKIALFCLFLSSSYVFSIQVSDKGCCIDFNPVVGRGASTCLAVKPEILDDGRVVIRFVFPPGGMFTATPGKGQKIVSEKDFLDAVRMMRPITGLTEEHANEFRKYFAAVKGQVGK